MGAIPDLDLARIKRYCDGRNDPDLDDKTRIEIQVRGRTVTIVDRRPPWTKRSTDWIYETVARLRFDPESALWTLYWFDSNSRAHRYDLIDPGSIDELLGEIDEDPTNIFWG